VQVWVGDIFIYYVISRQFGESWLRYSFIQLIGAPNFPF
jgi:hypothetical protein